MVLTGGPHLSVTQERGTRLAVEEERGKRWRGRGSWAAAHCARWAEGKDRGREGSGPSGRFSGRGRGKDKSFLLFLFKANFKFILKSV